MRPRISQREAKYILEVLKKQLAELELEDKLREALETDLFRLRLKLNDFYCGTLEKVAQVETYKEIKEEIERLEKRKFKLWIVIADHKRLIEKYHAIAEGNRRRGDYKRFNNSIRTLSTEYLAVIA